MISYSSVSAFENFRFPLPLRLVTQRKICPFPMIAVTVVGRKFIHSKTQNYYKFGSIQNQILSCKPIYKKKNQKVNQIMELRGNEKSQYGCSTQVLMIPKKDKT